MNNCPFEEFQQKQNTLTSGYLVLIDEQILYFATKKEWEEQKEELLSQNRRCYNWVDLEKWQQWKKLNH